MSTISEEIRAARRCELLANMAASIYAGKICTVEQAIDRAEDILKRVSKRPAPVERSNADG